MIQILPYFSLTCIEAEIQYLLTFIIHALLELD